MRTRLPVADATIRPPTASTSLRWSSRTRIFTGIAFAALAEAGDLVLAADHQPQRAGKIADADAEVRRALPVHRDADLRVAEVDAGLHVDELRQRPQSLVQLHRIGAELSADPHRRG